MNAKRLKNPPLKSIRPLRQADIDTPTPRKDMTWLEALQYLDAVPGFIMTAAILLCFVAGMWGLWLIWKIR